MARNDPNACPNCGANTGGGLCTPCTRATDKLIEDLKKK